MDKKDLILECTKEIEESIDFEFFKTLFDPVRCDIIKYLAINGANNIKDISENFAQDRSVISRHLDLMHRHGIVNKTKENRSIFYELNDKYILEKFELTATNLKKLIRQ
ncbi:transcriptional regulator [Clostridium botulinum]|jgi:DNA-binding transcriptional ArsR family regulator|uniref:ArsR-family transcriptional regulator n=6 Tax=Clostridium TaxID=1485 RepID=A5I046_CLOBH|nr:MULTISPECIES: winged helix-turn-helix domain-containing protein [Clostridium]MBE6077016.1 ArsR family transcriptional regulator [Clostridium lundense]ABS34155.1 transcriptional regulator, ArsR family [Clostridium botulinum A str. ATCC 19397]ABS38552.1 transcriptional regulator, ArsR family [Clostridium botulinum A str. Hall]ACO84583.1 transcriptional regulator, ArsR family [Clostridium botulinum A2 str. Kyoto]APH23475.1 bacterial regulatory, arsR family protein [Clostridium botulinum]